MDYLITGGAGFIGSHLAEQLSARGASVRVVDNFSTGKRKNLASFLDRIELVEGDIADLEVCRTACRGARIVLHQAALPSVPKSIADPISSHQANIQGTFNMLVAARDCGVKRFVYAASSSAYGDTPTLPKHEGMLSEPLSPYAVHKLTGECYCSVFAKCYGLETLSLRYFNVFGPRQDPTSQYAAAIPAFVTTILQDTPPTIFGDGEQTRDFTFIDNVVQANILAAQAPTAGGEVLNIACGESVTVNAIIRQINVLAGKNVAPKYVDARAGDIKHSWADISRAERVIGYRPLVRFDDGLRRAIKWYSENPNPAK